MKISVYTMHIDIFIKKNGNEILEEINLYFESYV